MRNLLTVNNSLRLISHRLAILSLLVSIISFSMQANEWNTHSKNSKNGFFSLDHSFYNGYSEALANNAMTALDCESEIEVEITNSSYELTLTDLLGNTPSNPSDYYYYLYGKGGWTVHCHDVGKRLLVIVKQHSTGESCSIWVNVKDGEAPVLTCDAVVNIDCQASLDDITIGYSDNCTSTNHLQVYYEDEKDESADCNNFNASTIIIRTWTVVDRAGNSSNCTQEIRVSRPPMSAVEIPEDVVLHCPNTDTDPSITGVPTINGKPFDHLCGVIVTYKDFVMPGCGETATIWRTWKITDCCTWIVKEKIQQIDIIDDTPPTLECPDDITLGTNRGSDKKWYTVPSIDIEDACDEDVDLDVIIDGFLEIDPGKKVQLGKGDHTITYTATDDCGNSSSCSYKVTIEDQDPPVIGCEDITVEVDFDQILEICVDDLENYIVTDNCGPIDLMIRKNQDFCEDGEDDLIFDDCVHFCCEDGTKAYVTIKATDGAGNVSYCRFNVTVIGPPGDLMIEVNPELTFDCDEPIRFDEPVITSVCAADVVVRCDTIEDRRGACGLGTLTKRYIAVNLLNGDRDTAFQTVTIVNPRPFSLDNIVCPGNIIVDGCTIEDAGDLGDISFRRLADLACFDIDTTVASSIRSAPDSCIIITRTWRITDKCQPDSVWICEQVIVINDSDAPELTGADDVSVNVDTSCNAEVFLGPVTAMDCDTAVRITNSVGGGATVDSVFTIGVHRIEFYGEDLCGNRDTLSVTITVEDEIPPVLICQDVTVDCGDDIPNTDPRALDNCGVDSIKLIDEVANLDDCGQGTITRYYRAWDSSQNSSTCEATITIQKNDVFNESNITWPRTPIVVYDCVDPGNVDGGVTTVDTAGIPCLDIHISSTDSAGSSPDFCAVIYRTWTVIDSCTLNQWDSIQVIAVEDTLAPILSGPRRNIVVEADENCEAIVELDEVVADDCDPNVVITNNLGGGSIVNDTFPLGVTRVVFTGVDSCGNRGRFVVRVTVQDSTPPNIVCRADRTVECGDPIPRIFPRVTDNCPGGRLEVDTVRIDMPCDLDTVLLIYTAFDAAGNATEPCTTKVIYTTDPFDCDLITLDQDTVDILNCELSIHPDSIGSRPLIPDFGTCHAFKILFSDEVSGTGPGSNCDVMVTRTWKIVDTCTAIPHDTCIKIQVLRIVDTLPPALIIPDDTCHFATIRDTMQAFIDLAPAMARDCDPNVVITNDYNDQGADIADFFPLGGTRITFTATDICGNETMRSMIVEVKDTIAPVFNCVKLFRHVSDDADPIVRVLAYEFVAEVFDNFSDSIDLKYSFSPDVNDSIRTYGCDSLGVLTTRIFVTDESGNQEACQPLIRILDTLGFCPPLGAAMIAGDIGTESGQMISDVEVESNGKTVMTDGEGHYALDALSLGEEYKLIPRKIDENYFNGVTTLDLLNIQKHLLGIEALSSPYAIIAADVNRSGDLSTLDVALIQLAILGRIQEDIDLGWRFVDKDFTFPNPANPWLTEFPEYIKYDGLDKNEMDSDFVAIKLGDVNNSAVAEGSSIAGLRNDSKVIMTTEDRLVEKGDQIEIEFKVQREITLEAMQWTLDYDESYLELVDMEQGIFETATDNHQGEIHHSWIFARGAQI